MKRLIFILLLLAVCCTLGAAQQPFYRPWIQADSIYEAGIALFRKYLDSLDVIPFDTTGFAAADSTYRVFTAHRGRFMMSDRRNIGAATGISLLLGGDSVLTKSRALGVKLPLVVGQYLKAVTIDSLESAPGNIGGLGVDSTSTEADSLYLFVAGVKYGPIVKTQANVIDYSPVTLNGNFETLGTGSFGTWVESISGEGTVKVDSATEHSGNYSAAMHAGIGYSVLKQSVLEAGKTYTLFAMLKVNFGGNLRMDFGDGNDTTITVAATWTAYTIVRIADGPDFQFVCSENDAWIDNVRLRKDD